jgi:hypothetical protein
MLRKRFPALQEAIPVFSVIATIFYLWTLVVWIWQVPSWLLFLTLGQLFSILAYEMVNCLLESLTFLAFVIALTAILPPRFIKNDFVVRSTWLTIGLLGPLAIYFICFFMIGATFASYQTIWMVTSILLSTLLASISGRVAWMRNVASWISDRLTIFLFLYMPASAISMAVVIVRNLL